MAFSFLLFHLVACGDEAQQDSGGSGITSDASFSVTPDGGFPGDGAAPVFDATFPGWDGTVPVPDASDTPFDGGDGSPADEDGAVAPPPPPSGVGLIRGPAPTAESASKAGPYHVESTTQGLRDGTAYADQTLWYPTDAEPPYGFVVVVPGFVSVQEQIKNWGPFLASHGIVTLTIGTNTPVDIPSMRADALLDALETVAEENTRSGSPLQGKLDTSRRGTIGWSMGGGGSLLAAERTPSLKAAISLCGWNPGYDYGKVSVPSLMFAIQTDALAAGQSTDFYNSIPETTPKLYWEADNVTAFFGGHDTFNDPAGIDGAAGRYGLSFLKVFLEGDERYRSLLKQEPPKKVQFQHNL